MSRGELKAIVDRSSRSDRQFLLAYLRTKDTDYRRRLTEADKAIASGQSVRLRVAARGLARTRRKAA